MDYTTFVGLDVHKDSIAVALAEGRASIARPHDIYIEAERFGMI